MKQFKLSKVLIRIGLLLIGAALLLTLYNVIDSYRAGLKANAALDELRGGIQTERGNSLDGLTSDGRPLYEKYPEMSMPQVEIDGEYYIGILSIPILNLELPVIGEFSYKNLRTAPCKYDGSVYENNMIIAAHNYSRHFGRLKNLNIGDRVSFTDGDGNEFLYDVSGVVLVKGTDIESMKGGDWDMTLFTCTLNGRERVAVRLNRTDS